MNDTRMDGRRVTVLTARFAAAVEYAVIVHAAQERKGTGIPYIAHLLASAALVLEAGGDEELAIAALLHDAAEDQGGERRLVEIAARFGARVAEIVRKCSDSLVEDPGAKAPWPKRKSEYVRQVRASTDRGHIIVSCADKLHNARAILQDFREVGPAVWERFTGGGGKTPEMIVGYYDALADAFLDRLPGSMSQELQATVALLVRESGVKPDRRWEKSAKREMTSKELADYAVRCSIEALDRAALEAEEREREENPERPS